MSDSVDFSKMKVVELRKELKTRGLSHSGDKSELLARLQAAVAQDDPGELILDSDEIDSDGVLEDEVDKSQSVLDESAPIDSLIDDLEQEDNPTIPQNASSSETGQKSLKRKLNTTPVTAKSDIELNTKSADLKESGAKKIILNRTSTTLTTNQDISSVDTKLDEGELFSEEKVKITSNVDPKTKMEMRAKRFGLPIKMSDTERKEARKIRFGQKPSSTGNIEGSVSENMEKLKKRAERFGQSVSKIMTDLEKREKIEKRRAKFGTVK